jgi:hypothetical protein
LLRALVSVTFLYSVAASGQDMTQEAKREAILKHPTGLKVELARRKPERYDPPDEATRPFRPTENIYFELWVTSSLAEPVEVQNTSRYYQNRPELFRDGEPVHYREDIAKALPVLDMNDFDRHIENVKLLPGTRTKLSIVELRDWYETLKPGRYRLTNRRRFIYEGDWVETSSIDFDVREQKTAE